MLFVVFIMGKALGYVMKNLKRSIGIGSTWVQLLLLSSFLGEITEGNSDG